jgi:hypothetical protein
MRSRKEEDCERDREECMIYCATVRCYTVKKAVKLLDAPSKNTFLIPNKYNSKVEIIYLDTHVFFPPLCYRMRKFDIREVQ